MGTEEETIKTSHKAHKGEEKDEKEILPLCSLCLGELCENSSLFLRAL
jgi:hypothetical protein